MLSFIFLKLTLQQVLADIPRDAGAILIYIILLLFMGLVWAGSRKSPAGPPNGRKDEHVQ